jgi:hypothetical protein
MKPIFLLKIPVIKRIQRIRMNIEIINPHCVPEKPEKSVENPVSYQQFEMFTFASY